MDFSNVDLALGTLTAYDSGSSVSSGSLAYAVGTAVLSQSFDPADGRLHDSDDGTFGEPGARRQYRYVRIGIM
mgnify:CR=1 FL=1